MLSRPIVNGMWYDKLSKSLEKENLLQNLNQARNEVSDTRCLVMSKVSKSDPKYSLRTEDCNGKHVAVCRAKPQMINNQPKPPKFPCLTLNHADRRKRSPGYKNFQEPEKYNGVLVKGIKYY